ncbi:flippase-like domain-containing protein [Enterococcus casseliflavus]|nr:flippase-like domain-containing protein [Enterococcus casseliflavus]
MKTKVKFALNLLLLVGILGVMYFFVRNSMMDILAGLRETSFLVVLLVMGLGTLYLVIEGRTVKEIAVTFQPEFTTKAGFLTVCYSGFYRIVTFGAGTLISEVNFYRKNGLQLSQGVGVTTLHMVMYKFAILTYAIAGLIIQFSLFYDNAPNMVWVILVGIVLVFLIIAALLALSVSINIQVFFVIISNKLFKSATLRGIVDKCNTQIYSLRETVNAIITDRTAFLRIYLWNLLKMLPWYVIPYVILVVQHPEIDFLLTLSFISFAVVLSGVIPTPAGIGSFEFIYMLLFGPLVGTVDAASSMLLYRLATFIWPFIIGFAYVMKEKRKDISQELTELRKEKVES